MNPNEFVKDLTGLINKHGLDTVFDTPDFVLAGYVMECLSAYKAAIATANMMRDPKETHNG